MPYYDKAEIARAREVDLLSYLQRCEPSELVHVGGNVYSTRTHDSLKISNGKWFWWSRGIGGKTALDYLMKVRGMTLPEAVKSILGDSAPSRENSHVKETAPRAATVIFQLPPKHADTRRVFAYLCSRGIDPEIINHCIKSGQLYEDAKRHNCVFVGFEGDTPRYAALRGTLSQSVFVGEVPGSDKQFSFAVPLKAGNNHTVCVFESAIDALSYLTLLKMNGHNWRDANVLSLAGVYRPRLNGQDRLPLALATYLEDNQRIDRIVLCLDNDEPGRIAAQGIRSCLDGYDVVDNPPDCGKDYNGLLQMAKGIAGRVKTRGDKKEERMV